MALKDIKAKIGATKRMHTVTRAMEAVSAAKMRKTQEQAFSGRPYARAALSILARLSGSSDVVRHPLAATREVKKLTLVVMTSDKGLAGALNSGVVKKASELAKSFAKEQVHVYAYGRKGEEFFRRRGYEIVQAFENKRDDVPLSLMQELARELSDDFANGTTDQVLVVYSNFKSTFEQIPTARVLLPLSLPTMEEVVRDIQPVRGKWSALAPVVAPSAYSVEPSGEEVISLLVPRLVAVTLYHMLLESKASEHSARMVAMKNASDKSKERTKDFTRLYNKIRQAAITREVSEIVSGRVATTA